MRAINRDTIVAVCLLLFCAAFYAATFDIKETTYATIGAEVWPRLILGLLFVLSGIFLVQSLRSLPPESGDKTRTTPVAMLGRYRNAIWCYALFFAFLLTLDFFGMLIGGVLFVFLTLTVLGERTPRFIAIHAAVAVISVGIMWSIFTFALRVILPQGIIMNVW